jgi:tetratricopeptide (TPR) repeat protein
MKKNILLIGILSLYLCSCSESSKGISEQSDYQPDSTAITFNDKGVKFLLQGNYKEAEEAFLKAINIDSSYRLAYTNLVNNKWEMGEFDESVEILNLWERRKGSDPGILFLKGASLFCGGRKQEALKVYKESEIGYKTLYLNSGKKEYLLNRMYVLSFLDRDSELSDLVEAEKNNHKEVVPLYEELKDSDIYKYLPCSNY